jgi:prolyl oligopeptidase PreP (S9A serine peptidase family)
MPTTFKTALAISLAAMCTAGLAAQTQETKTTTKTKMQIKGGKDVTVVGCLERHPNGNYILTDVREYRRREPSQYALVSSEDLSRHVGERVEVQGKAVTNGNGKVSVESKTTTEVENSKDRETKTKTEGTSGVLDMPFLGVGSMKTLSSSCY